LRELDPTRKASAMAGIGRAIDPTNKNSIVGKLAPYAVGLIPGIGLPLAAGLGAGIRGAQAVGRGEDLGGIAGSALRGAGEAGITRGIARAVMPGTFAPSAPSAVGGGAMAGLPAATTNLAPAASASAMPSGMNLTAIGSRLATGADTIKPGTSFLSGLGRRLTSPEVLTAGLQTGANIYGASQLGAAEDERLAMEREEVERRRRRVPFDVWQARRNSARIGGTPTV
jgi:hypothetical protein